MRELSHVYDILRSLVESVQFLIEEEQFSYKLACDTPFPQPKTAMIVGCDLKGLLIGGWPSHGN